MFNQANGIQTTDLWFQVQPLYQLSQQLVPNIWNIPELPWKNYVWCWN